MVKPYMVSIYSYLVKSGGWMIEPTGKENERIVPEEYRSAVAEFLASRFNT